MLYSVFELSWRLLELLRRLGDDGNWWSILEFVVSLTVLNRLAILCPMAWDVGCNVIELSWLLLSSEVTVGSCDNGAVIKEDWVAVVMVFVGALVFLWGCNFSVWLKVSYCQLIDGFVCNMSNASLTDNMYLLMALAIIVVLSVSSVLVGFLHYITLCRILKGKSRLWSN